LVAQDMVARLTKNIPQAFSCQDPEPVTKSPQV
jgi:hypothetical protein